MKIVVGEVMEDVIVCETDNATLRLPRELFPRRIFPGDVADYEDGIVTMWDEEVFFLFGSDRLGAHQSLNHLDLLRSNIHVFHLIHLIHHIGKVCVFCKLAVLIIKSDGI